MSPSSTNFDVCIRGAGIVGRSLALLLAAQQLRVALIHNPAAKSVSGHSDVVPVDGQAWSTDPFQADIRDGNLYGRGACDMKAGVVAMWAAVRAGQTWRGELQNRRKDGTYYWVMANVTPLFDGQSVTGYVSVRTEASRAEIDAAQGNRAVSKGLGDRTQGHDRRGLVHASGRSFMSTRGRYHHCSGQLSRLSLVICGMS